MRRPVGILIGLIACGVAVTAVLLGASGSSAQVTRLPAGSQILGYQLSVDAQGAATIVWSTSKFVGEYADSMIRVSEQNLQGKWSTPVQLGGLNQSLIPVLAESRSGAAVIVWSWVQGGPDERTVLEAVTRSSAGSAWSAPRTIWSTGNVDDALATAGIDSAGVATIVWTRYSPANPAIWSTSINTANATAATPQRLITAGAGGTDVSLAVNGAGAALMSWQRQLGVTQHKRHKHTLSLPTVHAAEMVSYRPVSGKWLAPHRLSTFAYQEEPVSTNIWGPRPPSSTVTTNGTAAIAWIVGGIGGGAPLEISTRNHVTGDWSPAHTIENTSASDPAVAAGPDHSLLALWSSNNEGAFLTATSTDGIRWPAASPLSSSQHGFAPFLASDPDGDDTIAVAGSRSRILFTTRTANNRWSALKLAGTGFNPEVAISDSGSITLTWEHGLTPHDVLETRTYP
jgi:hypothetical protein